MLTFTKSSRSVLLKLRRFLLICPYRWHRGSPFLKLPILGRRLPILLAFFFFSAMFHHCPYLFFWNASEIREASYDDITIFRLDFYCQQGEGEHIVF